MWVSNMIPGITHKVLTRFVSSVEFYAEQKEFHVCDWLSLGWLVPWINYLLPVNPLFVEFGLNEFYKFVIVVNSLPSSYLPRTKIMIVSISECITNKGRYLWKC